MAEVETPIGIIIPPVDIRNIVDKTAQFVSRNGPEFEIRIRKNEAANSKFNFLKDDDPYNSYYRHRIAAFKSGEAQIEAAQKAEQDKIDKEQSVSEQNKNAEKTDIKIDEFGNQIGGAKQSFINKEPPEKFEFIAEPPTIVARELDLIKLTAQFVAKNGKIFLTELQHKQAKNYHFDFLRPQHSNYPFFMLMVEQYTKILIPSNALLNKIKRDSHPQNASLIEYKKDVQYRAEWTQQQRAIKDKELEEMEKDKEEYQQIDWNDFIVVETVDYEQAESNTATDSFPAPVTVEELGKRLTQQLRYEEFGEDGIRQQLLDEKRIQEEEDRRLKEIEEAQEMARLAEEEAQRLLEEEKQAEEMALLEQEQAELEEKIAEMQKKERKREKAERRRLREEEAAKAAAGDDDDMFAGGDEEEAGPSKDNGGFKVPGLPPPPAKTGGLYSSSDDSTEEEPEEEEKALPSFINPNKANVLIKNYDPKKHQKTKAAAKNAERWLTSPLTGEKIRADKLDSHMKHGLLDPQWIETKKRQIIDQQHSTGVYAHNKEVGDQLLKVAQRRTDIFGVEETEIGKKVTETDLDKERQEEALKVWDGHAGSAEIITARAKKVSVHQQLAELKKQDIAMGGDGLEFSSVTLDETEEREAKSAAAQPGPKHDGQIFHSEGDTADDPQSILPRTYEGVKNKYKDFYETEFSTMKDKQIRADLAVPVDFMPLKLMVEKLPGHKLFGKTEPQDRHKTTMDSRISEAGGIEKLEQEIAEPDLKNVAGSDLKREAIFSGLTIGNQPEEKRPKMDSSLLDQNDFIHKYCSTGAYVEYTVKCPTFPQWNLKGQEITVTMNVKHTFTQLKKKLEEELGMPMPKQKLQYDGKFIKDNTTFAENNVIPGRTIHLAVKQRGGRNK